MDVSKVWEVTGMIAEMCEVITYLREDPNYTREEATDKLEKIIEMHMDIMYQTAISKSS